MKRGGNGADAASVSELWPDRIGGSLGRYRRGDGVSIERIPWRWAFVGLMFAGGLTVAAILWIKKYIDRQTQAAEQRSQE